jgi:hypothetical protein
MFGPHRWPIEREQSAALKDAVEDRVGQVFIMQHAAPGRQRLVRGENHGALLPMAVIDDMEEHVGRVGAVGKVADFVDNQDVRVWVYVAKASPRHPRRKAADRSSMSSAVVTKSASKPF